jgi:hypothetical protein
MSSAVQKTNWLGVAIDRHGCNGPVSAEFNQFDPHSIGQGSESTLLHDRQGMFAGYHFICHLNSSLKVG